MDLERLNMRAFEAHVNVVNIRLALEAHVCVDRHTHALMYASGMLQVHAWLNIPMHLSARAPRSSMRGLVACQASGG